MDEPVRITEKFPFASTLLSACASEVNALDDIARRFVGNSFSPITRGVVIEALTAAIRHKLDQAIDEIPTREAPEARCAIEQARDTLEGLGEFVDVMSDGCDGFSMSEKTISAALYDLTVRTGRAIESAEIACGANGGSIGYLDGDMSDPAAHPAAPHPGYKEPVKVKGGKRAKGVAAAG